MPRSNVGPGGKYYARYIRQYTKKNRTVIALGGIFIIGVIIGCLLLRNAGGDALSLVEKMLGNQAAARRGYSLYENFLSALSSSMIFAGALFVCGFCAIAQPVIAAAPLIRGLGFGFCVSSLYSRYGSSAIGFVGVLLLPGMLFSTMGVLIGCKEALRLSGGILRAILTGASSEGGGSVRAYCLGFVLAAGFCVAGAIIEAALYFWFANSFVLG
ncbi:MAG: hypothetical protein LBU86_00870 [Oscillospiraceae bacterium]|nr:hypothetical protein [Oscillospiraceae bacterium]